MKNRPASSRPVRGRSRPCTRSRGAGSCTPPFVRRRGEADVGVRRDRRRAVGPGARSNSSSSCRRSAARRDALRRPMTASWSPSACRGPRPRSASGSGARRGTCRRASTPAARSPPTHTKRSMRAVVVHAQVARAVLEAHEVARRRLRRSSSRCCCRSRAASSAAPPCPRPMRSEVAHGVEGDLRDRPRRPGRTGRRPCGPGRAGRPAARAAARSAGGPALREPERSASRRRAGPRPKVIVSRGAPRPTPRRCRRAAPRPRRSTAPVGSPGGHPPRRVGPRAQQLAQLRRGARREVERAEHEPRLRRRRHAGLMRARRTGRPRRPPARRRARRRVADREAGAARGGEPEGPAAGEQRARRVGAKRRLHRLRRATFPATSESGSASASTCWASRRRSAGVSSA